MPLGCGPYESLKKRARGPCGITGTLGMPLHGEDKVVGVGAFHSLFHLIFRAPGNQSQPIADDFRGLMMTGVDGYRGFVILGQRSGGAKTCSLRSTAT